MGEPTPISVQSNGVAHRGSYRTGSGMIEVSYRDHAKTTQLGGSKHAPEGLAKLILCELISEGRPEP